TGEAHGAPPAAPAGDSRWDPHPAEEDALEGVLPIRVAGVRDGARGRPTYRYQGTIEPAKPGNTGRDQALGCTRFRIVGGDADRFGAATKIGHGLLYGILMAAGDHDAGAPIVKHFGRGTHNTPS